MTKQDKKKILVTAALPYANGDIHLGHLVEYIQTDIFVRFLKLIGKKAIYCCADDTHGTPIEINAKKLGIKPEQLIAKYFKEHLEDFKAFHIYFDSYYSTNSKENKEFSDQIFLALKKKGLIYKKKIDVIYCPECKRFLPDRYVIGECPKCKAPDQYGDVCEKCGNTHATTELINPECSICGSSPEVKQSEHYFFKLTECKKQLENFLKTADLQKEVVNFCNNWLKELKDWDISRDGPYFGFKIPGEKDKYYYVWLDAPIGYIASTANYCKKHNEKIEDYWKSKDGEIIHVIGKDIIYFHFLFWPAMLINSGFNLPKKEIVHGFLTVNGEKMSKTRGTFLSAKQFLEHLPAEYLRYYYAGHLTNKLADIDLDLKHFKEKINNELIANIGNFAYRVVSFTDKNFKGKLSDFKEDKIVKEITPYFEKIKKNYNEFQFSEALKDILHISTIGNKYFQDNKPWELVKTNKKKAQSVVCFSVNILKNLTILLKPIIPEFSKKLEGQLNLKDLQWKDLGFDLKNKKIGKGKILLKKLENETENLIQKKEKPTRDVKLILEKDFKKLKSNVFAAVISGVSVKKKNAELENLKKRTEIKFDFDNEVFKGFDKLYEKIRLKIDCSAKKLLKHAKEKGRLPQINTVVDSYNIVAVKKYVAIGAHDVNKINGNVHFRIVDGSESYVPLSTNKKEKINKGEFAAVDDNNIVLCRLETKQGENTKIDADTKNIFVYVQGNENTSDEYLKECLKEVCGNITKFCGGKKTC